MLNEYGQSVFENKVSQQLVWIFNYIYNQSDSIKTMAAQEINLMNLANKIIDRELWVNKLLIKIEEALVNS